MAQLFGFVQITEGSTIDASVAADITYRVLSASQQSQYIGCCSLSSARYK